MLIEHHFILKPKNNLILTLTVIQETIYSPQHSLSNRILHDQGTRRFAIERIYLHAYFCAVIVIMDLKLLNTNVKTYESYMALKLTPGVQNL